MRPSQAILRVGTDHPHDLLALQAGHQIDFFTGNARHAARPHRPRAGRLVGGHAGLSCAARHARLRPGGDGRLRPAEAAGRRAVELEPRDGWAQHAVAHVLEMQGRTGDGIAWMRGNPDAWSRDSFFAVHNWWHLALYHLDRGETDEVLRAVRRPDLRRPLGAWRWTWSMRRRCCGGCICAAWPSATAGSAVADNWQAFASAGNYAFNDAHAVMAFVGAGRPDADRRGDGRPGSGDGRRRRQCRASPARSAGRSCSGLKAFGEGDYAGCIARDPAGHSRSPTASAAATPSATCST